MKQSLKSISTGKKVLFVATVQKDYIRVQQEIKLLTSYSSELYTIVSTSKYYSIRVLFVYFKCLFFIRKVDVVFFGFSPQLVLPFLKWRFNRKKIIIDFFISLYDTLVMDRQTFSSKSLISRILIYFDKLTLEMADLVITDTQEHANYFAEEFFCKKSKIEVLYLKADSRYYYKRIEEKPENLKNKYVVLYFGSILPLQGVEVVLDTIRRCNCKNIHFIMIGPVKSEKPINKNVTYINWLSQNELAKYIAFSDLCLAGHFNSNISKARRTIPGKAYIYEKMKKKIILGDNKANKERYPKQYKNVKFVEMGSSEALLKCIKMCKRENICQ